MKNHFGSRVRQARKNAGLTQAALAEKVNLDETTISRIENGTVSTSFSTMLDFSKALNVRFDYLICDYLEKQPDLSTSLDAEIVDLIRPLSENYKRLIRNNIQNLLKEFPPSTDKNE